VTAPDLPDEEPIEIPRELTRQILVAAFEARPREICGILTRPADQPRRANRWVPIANIAETPNVRYEMDPAEQLLAYKLMDRSSEEPLAVVHSHPYGPFYPSPVDREYAQLTPEVLQVVAWPRALDPDDLQAYRVDSVEGWASLVPITVVD
jgi:proteasome lid subunit RPN8/RPN11